MTDKEIEGVSPEEWAKALEVARSIINAAPPGDPCLIARALLAAQAEIERLTNEMLSYRDLADEQSGKVHDIRTLAEGMAGALEKIIFDWDGEPEDMADASAALAAYHKRDTAGPLPGDRLDMAYINSLPQPFIGQELSGYEWPIHDIDVQTGLLRIDVCGKLQAKHIGDFISFRDDAGLIHPAVGFYLDATPEERAAYRKQDDGEENG